MGYIGFRKGRRGFRVQRWCLGLRFRAYGFGLRFRVKV